MVQSLLIRRDISASTMYIPVIILYCVFYFKWIFELNSWFCCKMTGILHWGNCLCIVKIHGLTISNVKWTWQYLNLNSNLLTSLCFRNSQHWFLLPGSDTCDLTFPKSSTHVCNIFSWIILTLRSDTLKIKGNDLYSDRDFHNMRHAALLCDSWLLSLEQCMCVNACLQGRSL